MTQHGENTFATAEAAAVNAPSGPWSRGMLAKLPIVGSTRRPTRSEMEMKRTSRAREVAQQLSIHRLYSDRCACVRRTKERRGVCTRPWLLARRTQVACSCADAPATKRARDERVIRFAAPPDWAVEKRLPPFHPFHLTLACEFLLTSFPRLSRDSQALSNEFTAGSMRHGYAD